MLDNLHIDADGTRADSEEPLVSCMVSETYCRYASAEPSLLEPSDASPGSADLARAPHALASTGSFCNGSRDLFACVLEVSRGPVVTLDSRQRTEQAQALSRSSFEQKLVVSG